MDVSEFLPDRATLREYWPLFVGVGIIVVGNVYYYGVLGNDWQPLSPPLFVALAIVMLLEIARTLHGRYRRAQ